MKNLQLLSHFYLFFQHILDIFSWLELQNNFIRYINLPKLNSHCTPYTPKYINKSVRRSVKKELTQSITNVNMIV